MFDLLSTLPETMAQVQQNPLQVVEDRNGVFVKGLSCHLAQNEEEALNLLFEVCMILRLPVVDLAAVHSDVVVFGVV